MFIFAIIPSHQFMKVRLYILLTLIFLSCTIGLVSKKITDYINEDLDDWETKLRMQDQVCRFHYLDIYMNFVDTLFFYNHVKITKQQFKVFFSIDTVSYIENVDDNPNVFKVVGLPCYFTFKDDTLNNSSLLYYKPLHLEIDSFIKLKEIYLPYIPMCID